MSMFWKILVFDEGTESADIATNENILLLDEYSKVKLFSSSSCTECTHPAEAYLLPSDSRTRGQNTFRIPSTRKNVYRNSFFPRSIRDWNNLPSAATTTRWPLKRGSFHMKFSMTWQEKDDLLRQVTTWAGFFFFFRVQSVLIIERYTPAWQSR
jgi:hypothetical protein